MQCAGPWVACNPIDHRGAVGSAERKAGQGLDGRVDAPNAHRQEVMVLPGLTTSLIGVAVPRSAAPKCRPRFQAPKEEQNGGRATWDVSEVGTTFAVNALRRRRHGKNIARNKHGRAASGQHALQLPKPWIIARCHAEQRSAPRLRITGDLNMVDLLAPRPSTAVHLSNALFNPCDPRKLMSRTLTRSFRRTGMRRSTIGASWSLFRADTITFACHGATPRICDMSAEPGRHIEEA
ncbi:hypothetical protein BKA93DRAFT_510561 [Sparassis latifolia]